MQQPLDLDLPASPELLPLPPLPLVIRFLAFGLVVQLMFEKINLLILERFSVAN